jgi:hypothetical protein
VVADFVSGRFANGRGFGILNIVDFNGSGGTSIRPASPCNRVGPMRRDVEPDRPIESSDSNRRLSRMA